VAQMVFNSAKALQFLVGLWEYSPCGVSGGMHAGIISKNQQHSGDLQMKAVFSCALTIVIRAEVSHMKLVAKRIGRITFPINHLLASMTTSFVDRVPTFPPLHGETYRYLRRHCI